ncbi:MAG: O-acetylhomoserine aminocarboxypropyltransferase/cysteine synthase [Oscillospiraceae bacterium]|nr:O-acetylhomoserine aminocarboxypropyltransferase/cysteine synthase [Oscillospiraceae bacterium]
MEFNTALLHQAAPCDPATGATLPPVYQVSAFAQESAEKLERVFHNQAPGFAYTRIGNPTVDAFEKRIAALEGGIGAIACSSGMAAVTMALLNILQSGDEVIAGAGLFGGTIDLFGDLRQLGITARFADTITAERVSALITDKTRAVFTELIGNPKLNIVDLKAVSALCRSRGIPLIIDSTTATPFLIHPLEWGADIVIHSTSKYINGGGNAISGIIIDSGRFEWDCSRYAGFSEYKKFGKAAYLAKLRNGIWRNTGGCLAPFNAFLNLVGLETLGLRMERICENAKRLAEYLQTVDGMTVNYPALPQHPDYALVQSQFGGRGGAILTLRTGSKERAFRLINHLQYALNATNIGDVRTLVIHPASTIYAHSTPEQQITAGVYPDTIRISTGIEDIEDLIADFAQAIAQL